MMSRPSDSRAPAWYAAPRDPRPSHCQTALCLSQGVWCYTLLITPLYPNNALLCAHTAKMSVHVCECMGVCMSVPLVCACMHITLCVCVCVLVHMHLCVCMYLWCVHACITVRVLTTIN